MTTLSKSRTGQLLWASAAGLFVVALAGLVLAGAPYTDLILKLLVGWTLLSFVACCLILPLFTINARDDEGQ